MEEGGFVAWLKKDGEVVQAGEPLFTLEGDKATQDVEATDNGILHIPPTAPAPGAIVVVGALLGYLLAPGEPKPDGALATKPAATPASPPRAMPPAIGTTIAASAAMARDTHPLGAPTAPTGSRRVAISPRALRTAAELGVDWSVLRGTGRSGRIREQDVLAAAKLRAQACEAEGVKPVAPSSPPGTRLCVPASVPHGTIVITDWTFSDLAVEENILKPLGVNLVTRQCKSEGELSALVAEADVVVTQFGRLTARVIGAMRRARAIVRYGIGVDNIDLEAARARGIPVANVPDYCIDEVADQTLAFMLALTRQVVPYHRHVSSGRWGLALPLNSMSALRQLVVGVVGFGRIGREVVRRLLAFGCRLLVFDPAVAAMEIQRLGAEPVDSLDALLPQCDVLTLHCPSTAQTRRMLNAARFAQLKRGALLVNVARGDIIDTQALVDALTNGQVAAAALDVCDPEPIPSEHSLLKLPNVVLAPHIASVSEVAVRTLRETVATLAALALVDGLPPNIVNGVSAPRALD
jgi:D-3-phosphoglycerate dehydrogenase